MVHFFDCFCQEGFGTISFTRGGETFAGKVGAAGVCRRAGSTAALDRRNNYFSISRMPHVPGQYWNMAHGNRGEKVRQDEEGLQVMRTLGAEMAFLLKAMRAASVHSSNR